MTRRFSTVGLVLSLAMVLAPGALRAQSANGSISGTVMDPSGAVVPNAELTLTALGTREVAKFTTVILESGLPVNPGYSSATAGFATRPDAVSGTAIPGPKTVQEWFNTAAFTAPPFGHYGNAAVNCIRGPGMNKWDMGFFKNFRIKESAKFQFRAETFNTWNHTNFNGVDATYGTGGFGQLTSAHSPRVVQFALRLTF